MRLDLHFISFIRLNIAKDTDAVLLTLVQMTIASIIGWHCCRFQRRNIFFYLNRRVYYPFFSWGFSLQRFAFSCKRLLRKYYRNKSSDHFFDKIFLGNGFFGCDFEEAMTPKMVLGAVLILIAIIISETKFGFLKRINLKK